MYLRSFAFLEVLRFVMLCYSVRSVAKFKRDIALKLFLKFLFFRLTNACL